MSTFKQFTHIEMSTFKHFTQWLKHLYTDFNFKRHETETETVMLAEYCMWELFFNDFFFFCNCGLEAQTSGDILLSYFTFHKNV